MTNIALADKVIRLLHFIRMKDWFEGTGVNKSSYSDTVFNLDSFDIPKIEYSFLPDTDLWYPDQDYREIHFRSIDGNELFYDCYKTFSRDYHHFKASLYDTPKSCKLILDRVEPVICQKIKDDFLNRMATREMEKVFEGRYQRLDVMK